MNAPTRITPEEAFRPHPQLEKLERLIATAERCRLHAARGDMFDGNLLGQAFTNAAHDVFEIDALYDFARDLAPADQVERPVVVVDNTKGVEFRA